MGMASRIKKDDAGEHQKLPDTATFYARERVDVDEEEEEEGAAPSTSKARSAPGASKERLDNRTAPGDYYLAREEVDRWSKDRVDELMKGFSAEAEEGEEEDGCSERW
ncbi:hypothetical protein B0H13DRAFT_2321317 [Mycena leptocephala]|nr:hypothetical protein B0H13DRAFT_2321317 [Mycena leptocephala]